MSSYLKRFNLRVYGIWVKGDQVLTVEEEYQNYDLRKFPGGGVLLGEGILDALKREWKEEVGNELRSWKHFYTTEFFQRSFFHPEDQVVSIYYIVEPDSSYCSFADNLKPKWIPLAKLRPEDFTLPIDRHVARLLKSEFSPSLF